MGLLASGFVQNNRLGEGEREGDPKAMTESESSRKWTKGF